MKKIKMGSGGKMRTVPISELLEQRIEFQTITNNTPLLAFTIAEGVINPEDKKSNKRDFLMKDKDNKRFELTEKDDIIYNPANVVFGAIHRNALGKGVVSPIYKIFKCVNVDPLYMDCVVSRASFIHELSKYAEGSVTKLRTLAPESFLNLELTVPTDVDEQHKIGILIESLKTKIENEKKQTEKLKALRASLLDKMFPKEGKPEPEIRFDGFTDAWEQRKLDEIANFSKGVGYTKNDLCEEGTPIILYGRLYTKYETSIIDVDTFVKEKAGSVYSKGGEVIVPASGETEEDISIASVVVKPGILLGGDLNIVSPTTEYDSAFLALTISSGAAHKYLSSLAQGKSVVHLHNADIQSVSAKFPTKREQEKIHLLFGQIDTLITLHQRKYEKLIDTKKAFLEKLIGGEK